MTDGEIAKDKSIALFGERSIRREWDAEEEKWWFSVVDVVGVLTDQPSVRSATLYWGKLKQRLKEEGDELLTNCQQLKMMAADGKKYKTDVADQTQLLRIIQSIPSKKAEPFKRWLAETGSERLDQMADPEKSIHQALRGYNTNAKNPQTYHENIDCAKEGGNIAKIAREQLEAKTGKKVVSELNASEIRHQKLPEGEIEEDGENIAKYKNNIAMLRRMRGFTQAYMAEKLGVARQTYINIEKGLKELTISQVRILEEELHVSFEDLLGMDTENGELDYKKFLK